MMSPAPADSRQARQLAKTLRDWRTTAGLSGAAAAALLGISRRTLEGIEQRRGFKYPHLLTLAVQAISNRE